MTLEQFCRNCGGTHNVNVCPKLSTYQAYWLGIVFNLAKPKVRNPQVAWKWRKWTFGFWTDPGNRTRFGIDVGPLEICWRSPGYRQ